MKRKITGVCLAIAVTLGMWCGAQTSIEFASAYAESGELTDLEDILGDAESENEGTCRFGNGEIPTDLSVRYYNDEGNVLWYSDSIRKRRKNISSFTARSFWRMWCRFG